MATLTVWKFDTAEGADAAAKTLEELAREELIVIHDAATVAWEAGKKKPKTQQLPTSPARAPSGGAFWGLLFGLIFFVPLLGRRDRRGHRRARRLAGRRGHRRRVHQPGPRPGHARAPRRCS